MILRGAIAQLLALALVAQTIAAPLASAYRTKTKKAVRDTQTIGACFIRLTVID